MVSLWCKREREVRERDMRGERVFLFMNIILIRIATVESIHIKLCKI
jgi:hypothetical protein